MIATAPVELFRLPLYSSPQPLIDGKLPPTMGPKVARWMEKNLVHSEGDSAGKPVRLAPHQLFILDLLYQYDPETMRLLYDRVVIGLPKGESKTEDAARIGLAELAGPVRPLRSPRVVTSAASFDQADNVYQAARDAIEQGPLERYFDCWDTELLPKNGEGVMQRIAARGGTGDGKLLTCHIGDELHEWKSESQKRVYIVQGKGLRKRRIPRLGGIWGGLQVSISTAGDDIESLLGFLYLHGKRVAAGEVKDPRLLFLWWEAPKAEDEDLDDPAQLREAVLAAHPAAGPGGWREPEQIETNILDPVIDRHESERYDLNRWATSPRAWIAEDSWSRRAVRLGQPPAKTRIVLGFHGTYNRDATALVGWCIPEEGSKWSDYGFVVRLWEREKLDADWTVPRSEVDAVIHKAMSQWQVVELVCKSPGWVTEVEAWEQEYGERTVDPGDNVKGRGAVLRFDLPARMGPACDRFRASVLDPKSALHHDGSPELARHVRNCHTRETRYGNVIEKDQKDSPRIINLVIAAVIARQRAMHQPRRRRRSAQGF